MKVLLLGITGRVGSRLLPALLAHNHRVVAYVRSPSKISEEATSKLDSVVVGSGTDSGAIKAAILSQNCDAVVNAAGLAAVTELSNQGDLPAIFEAVVKAAVEARQERGGAPLRCWFLSGWSLMDSPKKPYLIIDYIPIYPAHRKNYNLIKVHKPDSLAWSLFCASNMPPKYEEPKFPAPADGSASNIVVKADSPPNWSDTMKGVPLLGTYLNIMAQAQGYYTPLEDVVDFLAEDLEKGLQSEFIGKRVTSKEKPKAE